MMNLTRSSFKILFSRLLGSLLAFLGLIYFARELGASRFGIFVLFQALSQMLAVPADFGLQAAVTKRMSEQENQAEILTTATLMLSFSLTLICIIIIIFQDEINAYLNAKLAIFLIITLILQESSKFVQNILRGELRVGETAILHFSQQFVYNGLGFILIYFGSGLFGLVYSLIAGFIVVTLWGSLKINSQMEQPSVQTALSLFNYAKFSVISYVDRYLYNWLDVVMIGILLTSTKVGAYEAAWRISGVVMLVGSAIETTILPQISAWDSENELKEIENLIPSAALASLFVIIPSFFGVLALSKKILQFLFTSEYTIANLILIILVGGKIFEVYDIILKNILSGMDRPDLRAISVIVSICLNIILNYVLIRAFGFIGASIATVISFSVSTLIIWNYASNLITIDVPYRGISACVTSSIIMYMCLMVTKEYIMIQSLPGLLSLIAMGSIIYFFTIIFFPSIRKKIILVITRSSISS